MKRKYSKDEVWRWMADNNKLYANKEDSNIFIRKRYGISWTVNCGNPWSWVIVGGAILFLAIAGFVIK